MRKLTALLLAGFLIFTPVFASANETVPIRFGYDLDTPTEVADDDQILQSVDLTNTSFTLDGDVDTPRAVSVTVTDTTDTISAGTITVTGTGINGQPIVWVIDVSGHAGGAVVYSSVVAGDGGRADYLFASVTDITADSVATLGGASDELIKAGTLDIVAPIWCKYGPRTQVSKLIETASAWSATVTEDSDTDPFAGLVAGDLLTFRQVGDRQETTAYIATASSVSSVILSEEVNLSTPVQFSYQKQQCGYSDDDGWINVDGASFITLYYWNEQFTGVDDLVFVYEFEGEAGTAMKSPLKSSAEFTAQGLPATAAFGGVPGASFFTTVALGRVRFGLVFANNGASNTWLNYGYNTDGGSDDASDTVVEILHAYLVIVPLPRQN